MDASWLIDRLKNPNLLERGDERHLRELIASYPYFSAPYLLLAKSLKDQNHPAFDDLLPLISLQAFDRKRLFKLVHENKPFDSAKSHAVPQPNSSGTSGYDEEIEVKAEEEIEAKVENDIPVSEPVEGIEVEPLSLSGELENEVPVSEPVEEIEVEPLSLSVEFENDVPVSEPVEGIEVEPLSLSGELENDIQVSEPDEEIEVEPRSLSGELENDVPVSEPIEEIEVEPRSLSAELENDIPVSEPVEEIEVEPLSLSGELENDVPVSEPVEEEVPLEEPVSRFAVNFEEVEKAEESEAEEHEEIQEIPFLTKTEPFGYATPALNSSGPRGQDDDTVAENAAPVSEPVEEREVDLIIERPSLTRDPESIPQKNDFLHWLDKLAPISEENGAFESFGHATPALNSSGAHGQDDEIEVKAEAEVEQPEPLTQNPEPLNESIPTEQIALIDKFIETNPSVQRVQEKMYDPAVQAKESERLDDTLMTETMARILVKQEKFERAIDAYKKLQLKYPQKSDYFAALIEEINRKRS